MKIKSCEHIIAATPWSPPKKKLITSLNLKIEISYYKNVVEEFYNIYEYIFSNR